MQTSGKKLYNFCGPCRVQRRGRTSTGYTTYYENISIYYISHNNHGSNCYLSAGLALCQVHSNQAKLDAARACAACGQQEIAMVLAMQMCGPAAWLLTARGSQEHYGDKEKSVVARSRPDAQTFFRFSWPILSRWALCGVCLKSMAPLLGCLAAFLCTLNEHNVWIQKGHVKISGLSL